MFPASFTWDFHRLLLSQTKAWFRATLAFAGPVTFPRRQFFRRNIKAHLYLEAAKSTHPNDNYGWYLHRGIHVIFLLVSGELSNRPGCPVLLFTLLLNAHSISEGSPDQQEMEVWEGTHLRWRCGSKMGVGKNRGHEIPEAFQSQKLFLPC